VSEHSGKDKNDDTFFAKYNLKKRPYLGPTSTDHELALLMANQGHCKEGDLVYDPFVGTGSIAVACQHFGACVIGSDIDMRVLKGYGVGRKTTNKGIEGLDKIEKFDIHTNFKYYRMPVPDFMAMDISALGFNMIKNGFKPRRPIFDAIVCDPPYGVRARS
jgi:tRNA (guanine10-N2)-methyltransferase